MNIRTDGQGNASIDLACGLATEVLHTFGELRLRIIGTSMAPTILPGDLVSIRRASLNEISGGEVVLFLQRGRLVVHRVVGRTATSAQDGSGEARLTTRGDRLRHDDPPVSSLELLGRVVSIERDNRTIELKACRSNSLGARLLRASDRVTYLYLRVLAAWRSLFFLGVKCRV